VNSVSLTHKKIDGGLEKISAFLNTKGAKALSPALEKRLDKIDFVDNLLRNGRSPKQVLVFMQKRFKEENISRATAYRYMADAKYVYGTINREDKEYWKGVLIDMTMETRSRARQAGDYKTMASCENTLYKIVGLDKDEIDLPPLDKIQPPIQVLNVTQNFIEKYQGILPKEVLNAAKKMKLKPTTIPIKSKDDQSSD
jgi:hypothetical protein